MLDLEKQIAEWRREMLYAGIKAPVPLEELETHLREEISRLINSGVAEAEAFPSAVRQLGKGEALELEFAKATNERSGSWRNNPVSVTLLAGWFILLGLNAAASVPFFFGQLFIRLYGVSENGVPVLKPQNLMHNVMMIILLVALSMQLIIGLGLFLRRNYARTMCLGWACLSIALYFNGLILELIANPASIWGGSSLGFSMRVMQADASLRYEFLQIQLPLFFQPIISIVNVGVLIWACYFLTRPPVRRLFDPRRRPSGLISNL